jgi:TM2 domain-containing membrane protein YozV
MASPLLAAILSFFIPGLGQFYNGQFLKAVGLFILAVIAGTIGIILLYIPLLVVWLYGMYDAYTTAAHA